MSTVETRGEDRGGSKKQDYLLPYHKVEQLMRRALAKGSPRDSSDEESCDVRLDREVVELMQEMATEFVCFVTSDMAEEVARDRRVALKGQDLVESLHKLGFSQVSSILEIMLPKLI